MSAEGNDEHVVEDEHQVWLQIGSKLIPEYPITSVTEALYHLKKAVEHPFQMYPRWYRTRTYTIGLDIGQISGAGFTGMNTKAGDLLNRISRDCADQNNGNVPLRVYCYLYYDCVLNVKQLRCRGACLTMD